MSPKDTTAPTRCFLYSIDCPAGQIFIGEDVIEEALEAGWKNTPPPAELLAQAAEESQADETGSAIQEMAEANQALINELETATQDLQAANKQLAVVEKKLAVATADKGGKGAGK